MKPELTKAISVYIKDTADKFSNMDFSDSYDQIRNDAYQIKAARLHILYLEASIEDIKKILS